MKIQFNPALSYQADAIQSITHLFEGQELGNSHFTVAPDPTEGLFLSEMGVGNKLRLVDDEVLGNLQAIQLQNGLKPSESLVSKDFTIEMETGTGKTYVYLRSMFELHQLYGFTKFIIVVPSIAIREGVFKSLQITEEHFKKLYDNTPYDYFIYNSEKLTQVRDFATSAHMRIMVINIDAFRKSFTDPAKENKSNIIHRQHDRMNGDRPIEVIRATNPIVYIDEPQSVDTTSKSQQAISSLNPLCTFRFSATHVDKHHMIYKLDSVDAYEQKLVKQIEVAGISVEGAHNNAYLRLVDVGNKSGSIRARIEIDEVVRGKIKRNVKTFKSGDDLFELSGGRSVYDGYIINEIYAKEEQEFVSFSNDIFLKLGQTLGDVDPDTYKRLQIRKTIDEHLEKELALTPKGIKVLSLFFIDKVSHYRAYNDAGDAIKGKYALMFEEEYAKAIRNPKYHGLFDDVDTNTLPEQVHNGYFAVDKKGKGAAQKEIAKDTSGTTKADEDAYALIMREKEKLLGFESKLKFIFSHSALREGWDNPNVFQICTLNETASTIKKRQEIGRGLRLAVNQEGERIYGFEVNRLTVMANESYEEFARILQKEIEEDEGIKFGVVELHTFATIPIVNTQGEHELLGVEKSGELWDHLRLENYIDGKGKVQDRLRYDLKNNTVSLPFDFADQKPQIVAVLRKLAGKLNIKNADERRVVKPNKQVLLSPEFQSLWNKIKYKTTYRVDFDSEALIGKCIKRIDSDLRVGKARFRYQKAIAQIDRSGVQARLTTESEQTHNTRDFALPDIISILQNATHLTRKDIVAILTGTHQLPSFENNPQKFIEQALDFIRDEMRKLIVDGIKYHKIGDEAFYAQELFESEELTGYLERNMIEAKKSVFDHVIYDSDIEASFAKAFEQNESVKLYAKLPHWFKVETPLGPYNPDWAVVVNTVGADKLYFVVETKGGLFSDNLRLTEQGKIDCGKEHFKALGTGVHLETVNNYERFLDVIGR